MVCTPFLQDLLVKNGIGLLKSKLVTDAIDFWLQRYINSYNYANFLFKNMHIFAIFYSDIQWISSNFAILLH